MTETLGSQVAGKAAPTESVGVWSGWKIHTLRDVNSTNLYAAGLPAWSAVRAATQTAGRGRFQRAWVSDEGGLWLSAVLPVGQGPQWRALPLAAGLAVCTALARLGVSSLRMRWPNDVLVGHRKLAGLLVDRFAPGLAVTGIGLNVRNRPDQSDPALRLRVITLADVLPTPPDLPGLTRRVLEELRAVVDAMAAGRFEDLLPGLNGFWRGERQVELDLDGQIVRGTFTGVDPAGRLALADASGHVTFYDASQVRHLTELETNT